MGAFDRLYKNVVLPPVRFATRNDAEVAHETFVKLLTFLSRYPKLIALTRQGPIKDPLLKQTLMDGLQFENPFGAAAGMDKNATVYRALIALTGVGHVEVGGVTLKAQPGNDRPRIVRADKHHLINAMGFPNDGADAVVRRLSGSLQPAVPLSVQIAKNKTTSDANVASEYAAVVRKFANVPGKRGLPDYFTINVSSPNTQGLRAAQAPEVLDVILRTVIAELDAQGRSRRRLLVKLAPDIATSLIDDVVQLVERHDIGGLVLTNTTTQRLVHSRYDDRPGGFSGPALYSLSSELVKYAASLMTEDRVLIACGGINSPERAYEMLRYANMIDAYTALVLQSPRLFRSVSKYVVERMREDGVKSLAELRAGNRRATHQQKLRSVNN